MITNEKIRISAEKNGVRLWEIAERFGVEDATFSRWLRREFSPERRKQALLFIRDIAEEHKQGQGAGV